MGAAHMVAVVMMIMVVVVARRYGSRRGSFDSFLGLSPTSKPRSFSPRCKERIMDMSTVVPVKEDIGNPGFWNS